MHFMFSKMLDTNDEVIETKNMPLEEWLKLIFNPPPKTLFIDYEVRKLLGKFLIPTGTLGSDEWAFEYLLWSKKSKPDRYKMQINHSYFRRLFLFATKKSKIQPWEGITWIV